MAEDGDEDRAAHPGKKSREPERGADVAAPEICERVKDEPVERDRQIQVKNNEGH